MGRILSAPVPFSTFQHQSLGSYTQRQLRPVNEEGVELPAEMGVEVCLP
jgi:hypothetical protein